MENIFERLHSNIRLLIIREEFPKLRKTTDKNAIFERTTRYKFNTLLTDQKYHRSSHSNEIHHVIQTLHLHIIALTDQKTNLENIVLSEFYVLNTAQ